MTERLGWRQRRFLLLLGAPALGMAMAVTVVSTYLPVLVEQVSGPIVVGALIGGEGFFGIFMPALVGGWSDRTSTKVGDRVRLAVVCAAFVVVAMVAIGLIAALGNSVAAYAAALVLLYAGYYAFLAAYWALYPDVVPREQSGRSRSAEASWRVTGVGLALIGGGLLLDVWSGLPFLLTAVLVAVTLGALVVGLRHRRDVAVRSEQSSNRLLGAMRDLLRDRHIRLLCLATGLWNFALSALRAFVVLFFTIGMDRSSTFVATVIFPLVAVGIAIGAPFSGWLADRWGHVPLLLVAVATYGTGMAIPGFTQASWVTAIIPPVALGAATVMTLPFSMLMRLLPEANHGVASGLFGLSRGIGATLGPVLTGVAIVLLAPVLTGTEGYAAMWLVCSVALLATLPLLWALRREERL